MKREQYEKAKEIVRELKDLEGYKRLVDSDINESFPYASSSARDVIKSVLKGDLSERIEELEKKLEEI